MSTVKQWCSSNLTHSVLSQTLNKFGSKYHLISLKYFGFLDNDAVYVLIKYKFLMVSGCNFITIDLFLLPSRVLYRSSLRNQNILQSQKNHSQQNYLIVKSIQESQLHRGRFASWSEIGDKLSSKSRDWEGFPCDGWVGHPKEEIAGICISGASLYY